MKSDFFDAPRPNSKEITRIHYAVWGEKNSRTLVCVHGLTGSTQDFKFVGESLAKENFRVVAVDMAGRGKSSPYPTADHYHFDNYLHDLRGLLSHIGCSAPRSCDWLGVSMGGLLGFRMAGIDNSPVRKMILSDIGPEVPRFDLDFIAKVIKLAPVYDKIEDAVAVLKLAAGTAYSRGDLTEEQWFYLAETSLKQRPEDGKFIRGFDPNIAPKFEEEPLGREDLWGYWEKTHQPTLALRGELSTLFPVRIAEKMKERKPNDDFRVETIPRAGHVPSLYREEQIAILREFLIKQPDKPL